MQAIERIIFCDNGISPREVDELFSGEYQAAKNNTLNTSLISFESLKSGDIFKALKSIRESPTLEKALYRGWMLKPTQYKAMYEGLLQKNIQLINPPEAYTFCHYLPENYQTIKDHTPLTTFVRLKDSFYLQDILPLLEVFQTKPIIVKDFVKSQKYYWHEACFIPDASDLQQVEKVVKRFLALQGGDLNEGLVFREYVALEGLKKHSRSDLPLTKEFRMFIKDEQIIAINKYWEEGDYADLVPDLEPFRAIIPRIQSNFFTMDIAKLKVGGWIIVELGDGQVSGLADHVDLDAFYRSLIKEK